MRALVSRPARHRAGLIVSTVITASLLASCAGPPRSESPEDSMAASAGDAFPVMIENCGREVTFTEPPERTIALGSRTALTMIALGLGNQIIGTTAPATAQAVPEPWRQAYTSLPILAKKDLSRERLLAAEPDFVYGAEASSFLTKELGTREDLAARAIRTYLHSEECPGTRNKASFAWDTVWNEIKDIATIFGVPRRAEELIQHQKQMLEQVRATSRGEGIEVLLWDMNTKSPLVVAGGGGPQLILDALGVTNVFGHINKDWASVSWEQVVAADPDVIVVTNAPWSSADEKTSYLESDPVLSQLTAVREQRYVVTSYSAINTAVRFVGTARTLGQKLAEFDGVGAR